MAEQLSGTLELEDRGGGRLRAPDSNYRQRPKDPFLPPDLVRKLGLRGGEDIIKAYALGANFVMLGRPFLYAAGAAGAAGVARIVELIVEELHTTLAQIGRTEVASLDSSVLVK